MKNYKAEILIILFFIVILSLVGCTNTPIEPCRTWQCEKQELRKKAERDCRREEFKKNAELWKIGWKVNYHCPEVARRMIP